MTLASPKDMAVYICFCAVYVLTIPLFIWRRKYTLISERTPFLVLWMQVPLFGLMTILCLLYNALIPATSAYGVTIVVLCLQTLFLCSVTTRIVNVAIKSIQQQHLKTLLNEEVPLMSIHQDTPDSAADHSNCVSSQLCDIDEQGTVQYLWWKSTQLTRLGRYQKVKHTFSIYLLILLPWFIALATIFSVNEHNVGDAALNDAMFWYRVAICTTQISLVVLVFPLVVVDIFFLTFEVTIVAMFLLGDAVSLVACRYAPPDPSHVLGSDTCSHYVYGCLFSVHVLTILVPTLLTFIPVMRTQRVLLQSDVALTEDDPDGDKSVSGIRRKSTEKAKSRRASIATTIGAIDADDTTAVGNTREDECDEETYVASQPLPLAVVLTNRTLATMFYKHLSREYATENFLFVLSINRFRSRFNLQKRLSCHSLGRISSHSTGSELGRMSGGGSVDGVADVVEQVFVDTSAEKGANKHKPSKMGNNTSNVSVGFGGLDGPALLQVAEIECVGSTPANVNETHVTQAKSDLTTVAERIYQRFMSRTAEFQVNLTHGCVANIERLLESGECYNTMFDEAAHHVSHLLEMDPMPRFKKLHGKAIGRILRNNKTMYNGNRSMFAGDRGGDNTNTDTTATSNAGGDGERESPVTSNTQIMAA